jgi:hypothetical protein
MLRRGKTSSFRADASSHGQCGGTTVIKEIDLSIFFFLLSPRMRVNGLLFECGLRLKLMITLTQAKQQITPHKNTGYLDLILPPAYGSGSVDLTLPVF